MGRPSSDPSPFADLFERLGLVRPSHKHDHDRFMDSAIFVPDEKHRHAHPHGHQQELEKGQGNILIEGWKHHVEEMFGGAKNILPILQGGDVRLLNTNDQDVGHQRHGHGHYKHPDAQALAPGQHLRPHGGHHWQHKASSFGSR